MAKKSPIVDVVPPDPMQIVVDGMVEMKRVVDAARTYCHSRDHPTAGQHESVEPYYYRELLQALKKFSGPKGSWNDVTPPTWHYARTAGVAFCGADKTEQNTTQIVGNVTCVQCLDAMRKGLEVLL